MVMDLGLAAIAEYFYEGLPSCLSTLQEGLATAWTAENGVKPVGLDPTGGSAAVIQERTERAARQLARGQEQLVLLLLTAIVTYLTRGQMKAGVMNSVESIATRSATLQASISNKEFASWLAKNQSRILAEPELQIRDVTPLRKGEPEPAPQVSPSKRVTHEIESSDESDNSVVSRRAYLNNKYGRTGDVNKDIYIRANKLIATDFFQSQGATEKQIKSYMNGLDFSQPVRVETLNAGKKLWQYQVPGGRQGIWYSPTPNVAPTELGINPLGTIYKTDIVVPKVLNVYQTTTKVDVLRSTSAPALDIWSTSEAVPTLGGARQITTGQNELFKLMNPGE
jgi:hypothetical protein